MADDLTTKANSFLLMTCPTDDDVYEANFIIDQQAARIRELEAQVVDLGAIQEKAHREGYTKGKAAGDAFGASMREYVERLEAQVSAPVTVSEAARVLIERIPCDEDAIAKVQRYARFADFLNALRAILDQNDAL